jgi:phosphoribosyl-ATP pyrophosphohydrolase/phosphoribosyl-AMP cyclohydrolase
MELNFKKYENDLMPVVVQDVYTQEVLMQAFMTPEALARTVQDKKVTFFSRSKKRLWTKGETSGNFLNYVSHNTDCDGDSLLIFVKPEGPACHTGTISCFQNQERKGLAFLNHLDEVLESRKTADPKSSYTAELLAKGINKVAQKVGEEAVELVIEAKDNNPELFLNEAADLMYHYLLLLRAKNHKLEEVLGVLESRHK